MSESDLNASAGAGVVLSEQEIQAGGVRFAYAIAGAGPPVVLLPGSGGWRLTLGDVLGRLARAHTVYAVDPPGQGRTEVVDPAFSYHVDAITRSLARFLDAVGLSDIAIVGHSWGGGYALRLAELHPDRVARLALLAPAGLDVADVWEFRALRLPVVGELATRFTSTASIRHMMRKALVNHDKMPATQLMRDAAWALRSSRGAARRRHDMLEVERSVDWSDTERDLDLVTSPTLILWGDQDRYLPVHLLDRFTSRLSTVEAHVLTGAGHAVHDDVPEQAYPHLNRHLASTRNPCCHRRCAQPWQDRGHDQW